MAPFPRSSGNNRRKRMMHDAFTKAISRHSFNDWGLFDAARGESTVVARSLDFKILFLAL
jgi:hypothetical protein